MLPASVPKSAEQIEVELFLPDIIGDGLLQSHLDACLALRRVSIVTVFPLLFVFSSRMNSEAVLLLETVHFAAEKHRNQRRKDTEQTPYINHPIGTNVLTFL